MTDDAVDAIHKARMIYIQCGNIYHELNQLRGRPVRAEAWEMCRKALYDSVEELAELAARGPPEQQFQVSLWLTCVAQWLVEMPVNC